MYSGYSYSNIVKVLAGVILLNGINYRLALFFFFLYDKSSKDIGEVLVLLIRGFLSLLICYEL